MDKETLSHYGWIVVLVLILAVLLALASPFGNFLAAGFKATYAGFGMVGDNALGIISPGSVADVPDSGPELTTITEKEWNIDFYGYNVWHDNDGNIYYSNGYSGQYILKDGNWVKKEWTGLGWIQCYGVDIWHDNDGNIYYTGNGGSYVFKDGDWVKKPWSEWGFDTNQYREFYGQNVWKGNDGNIYYSNDATSLHSGDLRGHYVLQNGVWVEKEWTGFVNEFNPNNDSVSFTGEQMGYDASGNPISINSYATNDGVTTTYIGFHYILQNGTWVKKDWGEFNGLLDEGSCLWSDNNGNTYYSLNNNQYLVTNDSLIEKDWGEYELEYGYEIWKDNDGNIYYSHGAIQYVLE